MARTEPVAHPEAFETSATDAQIEVKYSPRAILRGAAEVGSFTGRSVLAMRGVWRYGAEVIRQCGILILGSGLLICFMQLLAGGLCGLEADYFTRGIGASGYSGLFTALCDVREIGPLLLGYIFAAKVGCGLVAEIGSMRINEELDAIEAQGVDPMRYVIATRLLAVWICVPLLYAVSLAIQTLGSFIVVVLQLQTISQGTWEYSHWGFQNVGDLLLSEAKVFLIVTVVTVVSLYFGYRARGGPVGVGAATGKSMIANLVAIHVIGGMTTMSFWGLVPRTPIGG